MKHEKYKELLELNVLNELSDNEQLDLENHLLECDECTKELAELKKLYSIIVNEAPEPLSDRDLERARLRLFNSINVEPEKISVIDTPTPLSIKKKFNRLFSPLFSSKFRLVFASIALVIAGLFAGYLIFRKWGT
jgi:hypothetical protein